MKKNLVLVLGVGVVWGGCNALLDNGGTYVPGFWGEGGGGSGGGSGGGGGSASGSGGAGGNGGGSASGSGGAGGSGGGPVVCSPGLVLCGDNLCVDTKTDPAYCGSCDNACAAGQICANGGCQWSVCTPGMTEPCYSGPPGTAGVGLCVGGTRACNVLGTAFGACDGEVVPAPESCATLGDDDCNGNANVACIYPSCGTVPQGAPTGIYKLDPDGAGVEAPFDVYCNMEAPAGPWALVYSSNGSVQGTTTAFWKIPYADRMTTKLSGSISPQMNTYMPRLYLYGKEYFDEIQGLDGVAASAFRADVTGFNKDTMRLQSPHLISGNTAIFSAQFATGWSSNDFDGDTHASNCATSYESVSQHYSTCWSYSLGSDADGVNFDAGWGPHIVAGVGQDIGLTATDGSQHTRVQRITRWTKW